jgi:RNA polymerase sigma factor (sigma-70 family)
VTFDDLVREVTPRVLATLVRRYGDFDACEDALQEALLAAAVQWPAGGEPDNPAGWLLSVAARRRIDAIRSDAARRDRERQDATLDAAVADTEVVVAERDDALLLLFMCAHPAASAASQIALTLRAVGGLSTAEIASAFLVTEATMAQRISRAKATIKASGQGFTPPTEAERDDRLRVVQHVLYLIFNEGYTAVSGADLTRPDLTAEAIRLTRELAEALPGDDETHGLLALMLLTDSRRDARCAADGRLVPLAEQDRSRWNRPMIDEGVALVTSALSGGPLGAYQLQAAIAATHAEAATADDTDWHEIAGLYVLLDRVAPSPMVTLNRAVAVGMADGPQAGLDLLTTADLDHTLAGHHRVDAVRGHLLELAGDLPAARAAYQLAASRTTSAPERDYLLHRAYDT